MCTVGRVVSDVGILDVHDVESSVSVISRHPWWTQNNCFWPAVVRRCFLSSIISSLRNIFDRCFCVLYGHCHVLMSPLSLTCCIIACMEIHLLSTHRSSWSTWRSQRITFILFVCACFVFRSRTVWPVIGFQVERIFPKDDSIQRNCSCCWVELRAKSNCCSRQWARIWTLHCRLFTHTGFHMPLYLLN